MMTIVVIALTTQIIIIAHIHTISCRRDSNPDSSGSERVSQPLSQAPAGSQRRAQKIVNMKVLYTVNTQMISERRRARRARPASRAGLDVLNARKTATAPMLMAEAWIQAHSIGRTGMRRPVYEAARSAAADSPCLGSGSVARTLVRACF
jgi:hypothetical protein